MAPLTVFLALVILLFTTSAARCVAQTEKAQRAELQKYVETEKYVLEQIAAGRLADLSQRFKDDEQKRVLPANFIEALLMNPKDSRVHRNGVQISGARIVGLLNLGNTTIQNYVLLSHCEFDDVSFFQTAFEKGLGIDSAIFHGKADFGYATVMEGLAAGDARFLNAGETAIFDSIKVRGPFYLAGATFAGPATFLYAVVDGAFDVTRAQFLCQNDAKTDCAETRVSFNTMQIGRGFFAMESHFERPVDLINLRVGDNFEGQRSEFKKSTTFSMMSLGHNLFLSGAKFGDDVSFNSAHVAGNVLLDGVEFAPNHLLDLSKLTYADIYPTAGSLELIQNSNSDYSAYTELENCLQRNGDAAHANDVFIAKKRLERKGLKKADTVKSYFSEYLQGFGRIPQRVLYYDFAFIVLGAFIFRRKKMVFKKPAETVHADTPEEPAPYNAFLYSLTLFAPTIDNQYTNNWKPAAGHRKTRWYMTVQKWAGYIFVPLTIGIWTGIFR